MVKRIIILMMLVSSVVFAKWEVVGRSYRDNTLYYSLVNGEYSANIRENNNYNIRVMYKNGKFMQSREWTNGEPVKKKKSVYAKYKDTSEFRSMNYASAIFEYERKHGKIEITDMEPIRIKSNTPSLILGGVLWVVIAIGSTFAIAVLCFKI